MFSPSPTKMEDSQIDSEVSRIPSVWKDLTPAAPDPVFGLIHNFLADPNPKKVLLGVGAYRDDAGKPYVLNCVKKAEQRLLDLNLNKEYAFPDGIPSFRIKAMNLAYGVDHPAIVEDRVASMQTVSGTGALCQGFSMIRKFYPTKLTQVWCPNVTWSLHHNIIAEQGFEEKTFRYYNPKTKSIDIPGMLEDLEAMDDEQVLLI
jgi:aspartate aminotransferase, mitochondrial